MSPVTRLTIRPALATPREMELIAEARRQWAEAEAEEQHWSGPAGLGGDVRPSSTITFEEAASRVAQGVFDGGGGPEDLDRASSLMMARAGGDALMARFAAALRRTSQEAREAAVVYESWLDEKEMAQMANATESMTRRLLDGLGEAYREDVGRRWPANNAGKVHEPLSLPRTGGYAPYPTATKPEPVDEDRAARGAREPSMSDRLRGLAREVQMMAGLSADSRTKNRLMRRAGELQRMALRQYSREMENDYSVAGDDAGAELNALADDAARDADRPAQDAYNGGEIKSFDDWDNEPRQGSEQRAQDDAALQLDEDVPTMPRVPAPGRRIDEDQLSRSDTADEPRGGSRATYDDEVMLHTRRGLRKGAQSPHGPTRYARAGQMPGSRYSAFDGKESLRESGGTEMTDWLLGELEIAAKSSHSFF